MSRSQADLAHAADHRRLTARQVRHGSKATLQRATQDEQTLEDADVLCPTGPHDLGRKSSPPRVTEASGGRRPGFKVWKTPYWKRRSALWASRNDAERGLA
ncbi:MAG: hypothetical protein ACRDYC_00165 [Acidimicrobiales bacterium]